MVRTDIKKALDASHAKDEAPKEVAPTKYAWEAQRAADWKKVKGIFRDLEVKGGRLQFAYKKWQGEDIQNYDLHDGQEYELPMGVVRHLNNIHYTEDSYSKDLMTVDGRPMKNPNPKKISRFSFQPKDFVTYDNNVS